MKQKREVRVVDLIVYFWLQLAIVAVIWTVFGVLAGFEVFPEPLWAWAVCAVVLTYVPLRLLAMGCVLMYKAYAPMSVRNRCRFTPSCSTYMLVCLRKYGLIVGFIKGIRRITRCHPPNGGEDLP